MRLMRFIIKCGSLKIRSKILGHSRTSTKIRDGIYVFEGEQSLAKATGSVLKVIQEDHTF